MEKIISLHQDEYVSDPEIVVESPAAVTVMGNHVDSDEGFMIQAALDLKVFVAISRRKDNSLRFYAVDFAERKRTSAANIKYKREDRWANYIKSVIFSMENSGYLFKGLDVTLSGNIPQGIGLSSSSSIETATALALSGLFKLNLTNDELVKIIYYGEEKFLGSSKVPSGVYSALYGQSNKLLYVDLRSSAVEYLPVPDKDVSLILTVSNVPLIPVDKEVQERRRDTQKCVEGLNSFKHGTALRDYSNSDLRHGMGVVPEHIRRRCLHVVDEITRTEESRIAIKRGDMVTLGKLMNRSHESLRDNFEVSCPEIDWLVKRAQEIDGIYGSKITGTGFGGCTITLIKNTAIDRYREKLDEYERIFGFKADMINCNVSSGAKIVYSLD
ncbi:MAG: galactokinase [Spirochaetia bacterium]|jgi:galactokinase|nr:galactokinase [Spirochaetia bacterium]